MATTVTQIGMGPSISMACGSKHDPNRRPSPLKSAWQLTATGAMAINTDPIYCRTKDPDMASGSSLSQVSSIPTPQSTPHHLHHGPRWANSLQHLLTSDSPHSSLSSFFLPAFSTVHEPFCFSLPFLYHIFHYHKNPHAWYIRACSWLSSHQSGP